MEETMFLGLRMMKGVGRKEFSECYGKELDEVYGDTIRTLKEEGLLEEKNSRVYLTPVSYTHLAFLSGKQTGKG